MKAADGLPQLTHTQVGDQWTYHLSPIDLREAIIQYLEMWSPLPISPDTRIERLSVAGAEPQLHDTYLVAFIKQALGAEVKPSTLRERIIVEVRQ